MTTRIESDSMGRVPVDAGRYWGAQTQRSLNNFKIGTQVMPLSLIKALALVKKTAATVNTALKLLDPNLCQVIHAACDEIIKGEHNDQFPLVIWQTGSGTQTNMNLNEVIANRANEMLGGQLGTKTPIHPNDHVNMSQSSNDTFPTAMHLATVLEVHHQLFPALEKLAAVLKVKENEFASVVKVGRTHCQDAVPITMGQVFSGYGSQINQSLNRIRVALDELLDLAQGGTAVGTGLNAPTGFAQHFATELATVTGHAFRSAPNKFSALASHDPLVHFSGTLNTLAVALMKIANDIRMLGSGPRCGLGELILPTNEPGSSIMPGKVNPTQCEAMTMICAQVMGNHHTITIAGMGGQFELNVFKPVIIYNILQTINLLSDGCNSFVDHCLANIQVNQQNINAMLDRALMVVTSLAPHIGYDQCALIVHKAYQENISVRQAALDLKALTSTQYDAWVQPAKMV